MADSIFETTIFYDEDICDVTTLIDNYFEELSEDDFYKLESSGLINVHMYNFGEAKIEFSHNAFSLHFVPITGNVEGVRPHMAFVPDHLRDSEIVSDVVGPAMNTDYIGYYDQMCFADEEEEEDAGDTPFDKRQLRFESENNDPVLIMMMGLPGCGKSTAAKLVEVYDEDGNSCPVHIHSSDALRLEMFGDEDHQSDNVALFNELHKRIKDDLRNGISVVYDATNIYKKRRRAFLAELTHIRCKKVCVCFATAYEDCLRHNKERERQVPEEVIRKMYTHWSPPSMREGFRQISVIVEDSEDKYTIENFLCGKINAMEIDQDNPHHTLTIGEHCCCAAEYVARKYGDRENLIYIVAGALLHDCGKPFVKSRLKSNGEMDDKSHYYGHECCGAYDALIYASKTELYPSGKRLHLPSCFALYISEIVYYHMRPFLSWDKSEEARKKAIDELGSELYEDVMIVHEADIFAK